MTTNVTMPRMSESMEQGTVLRWLVEVGADVKRGDPLVEIETDKASVIYEADTDGVLLEVLAGEGQAVAIGEVIARIGSAHEAAGPSGSDREGPAGGGSDREGVATGGAAAGENGGDGAGPRPKASPIARRLARELGIDLNAVRGSGPQGRIVRSDIEAAMAATETSEADPGSRAPVAAESTTSVVAEPGTPDGVPIKGEPDIHELTRLQRTVGRRMAESKATAPEFQLQLDIDMTHCMELRLRLQRLADPAPSVNDMVVKAAAGALRRTPRVNGAYRDGRWELYARVNVGLAVATAESLLVPVVFDADEKSLVTIARETRELIAKAREGAITQPELTGGTFTISNLGMYEIDSFSAIINPPQAAILAVGAIRKRPVVDDAGSIVAQDTMTATLSCDHRILYGTDAAEFLGDLRRLLEEPLALLLA